MSFIKCPHCRHSALSVASRCPGCGAALGASTLGPEHHGTIVPCVSCGCLVRSRSKSCPHCGAADPGKQRAFAGRTVTLSALVVAGLLAVGGWSRHSVGIRPSGSSNSSSESAEAASENLAAAAPVPSNPPPDFQTRWTASWANARLHPQPGSAVIEELPPGTRVDAVRGRSGWWLVYLDGDSVGYVAGSLLRADPPDSLGGGSRANGG